MKTRARKSQKKPYAVKVSDHAVVRYIERVMGIDTDEIREAVAPQEIRDAIKALKGSGQFPVGEHKIIAKDNIVVTVITKEGQER